MTSAMFTPLDACWICGGRALAPYSVEDFDLEPYRRQDPELATTYNGKTFHLQRCRACGFGQPDMLPALPAYFDRIYAQEWPDDWMKAEFTETYRDYVFEDVLNRLAAIAPSHGRLLDVGSHVGKFVHQAAARGWNSEGVELNPRTAAVGRQLSGRVIHELALADLAKNGERFDVVTFLDVLEHIPDPRSALVDAHAVLKKGGWIVVKVPAGRPQWLKERIRGLARGSYRPGVAQNVVHVNHFSSRSLRLALESTGFADVSLHVGAPELFANVSWRAHAFRKGVYYASQLFGTRRWQPFALNLLALARA